MKSKPVWVWLPDQQDPVHAADLHVDGTDQGRLVYRKTYMDEAAAFPLDPISLRFDRRERGLPVFAKGGIPSVIMDACPSGYGAELITRQHDVSGEIASAGTLLPPLQLLELGDDDAAGALAACDDIDRKLSRKRPAYAALAEEIARLEATQSPSRAIRNLAEGGGTSAGGERPKITVEDDGRLWLAKMQDRNDIPFLPAKEFVCMTLASQCDITIPAIRLERVNGAMVFMIERFDRHGDPRRPARRMFASAKTALGLAPEAVRGDPKRSYLTFADKLRRWSHHADHVKADLQELWRRMAFNALVGNSDDHPLNHGLYRIDGSWRLSPAYDITPQSTFVRILSLSTSADGSTDCAPEILLASAGYFGLSVDEAKSWLASSAAKVANGWEKMMLRHGVSEAEIGKTASAFVIANEIASGKHDLDQAAERAHPPAGRRRASTLRRI